MLPRGKRGRGVSTRIAQEARLPRTTTRPPSAAWLDEPRDAVQALAALTEPQPSELQYGHLHLAHQLSTPMANSARIGTGISPSATYTLADGE